MKDPLLRDYRYLNLSSSSSTAVTSSSTTQRSIISTSISGQELWPVGVKLGIVRLGYSAGKLKYTLVDEEDIVLAREYTFEARLEVDQTSGNASGAVVFAYAYLTNQQSSSSSPSLSSSPSSNERQMILLQDLIWRRHRGPIPERKRVVHRNHISMDNRLDNLCLLDLGGSSGDDNSTTHVWYTRTNQVHHHNHQQFLVHHSNRSMRGDHHDINNNQLVVGGIEENSGNGAQENHHYHHHHQQPDTSHQQKSSSSDLHLTLYWAAIQQLPPEHLQQQQLSSSSSSMANTNTVDSQAEVNSASKCYDSQGNLLSDQESISYFECHYGPCVYIERCPKEFSICGRCQETRYCGTTCQQLDWPYHKRYCRYKARRTSLAPYSYRPSLSSRQRNNHR